MGEHEDVERRVEMAVQIARLETQVKEKFMSQQDQLTRIERMLNQQTVAMEKMMGEFTQKIDDLDSSVETKVDDLKNDLDDKIEPIKGQINIWRGAVAVLSVIVVAILIPLALKFLGA